MIFYLESGKEESQVVIKSHLVSAWDIDVCRTLSNMYGGAFCKAVNNEFKAFTILSKNAPSIVLKSHHLLN